MTLKTLLRAPVTTIQETATIGEARTLMHRHGVRCLPVLRGGDLVGLVTDLDLDLAEPSSLPEIRRYDWTAALAEVTVADVMSRRPYVLTADTPVAEAARLARSQDVEAFLVLDDGVPAGVVTRGDLLGVLAGLLAHRDATGLGHVLAATSLRSGPEGALGEALRLASACEAALTALHVLPVSSPFSDIEGATLADSGRFGRARARIARQAAAAQYRAGCAHEVTCDVGEGAVVSEIARRAAELDSDLIVIGKTIPRGWRRACGRRTLADQLVRLAPCPVLAIPRRPGRYPANASR